MNWYIEGKELGLWVTPNTNDSIRIYYVKDPTDLSANTDTADAILEDYEDGLIYYAIADIGEQMISQVRDKDAMKILVMLIARAEDKWREVLNRVTDGALQNVGVRTVKANFNDV